MDRFGLSAELRLADPLPRVVRRDLAEDDRRDRDREGEREDDPDPAGEQRLEARYLLGQSTHHWATCRA